MNPTKSIFNPSNCCTCFTCVIPQTLIFIISVL
jgi:hypothetical protein